jgi:hypothetical protein
MELGLFVILTIVGALGYWKNNNMYMIAISIVAFFIAALLISVDGEIVQTESVNVSREVRAANGTLIETETETGDNKNAIVTEQSLLIAYLYYGFAAFTTLLFMYRSIQLGQSGRY